MKSRGQVPVLANIRPSGEFLMEDFYYAGGLRALMAEITDLLDLDCLTVNGKTIGENLEGARVLNPNVIRERAKPLMDSGGTAILFGSLAPDGAVIKIVAADRTLLAAHRPRGCLRQTSTIWKRASITTISKSTKIRFWSCRTPGRRAVPACRSGACFPFPKSCCKRGMRDMVRISDARMSGTAYGTCVLHVAPESYVGGPLALVQDGDLITLDIPNRKLDLLVPEEELAKRRAEWKKPVEKDQRGYLALYREHVSQANEGCDFDFLKPVGAPASKI